MGLERFKRLINGYKTIEKVRQEVKEAEKYSKRTRRVVVMLKES